MGGIIKFFLNNAIAANLLIAAVFMMGFFGLKQTRSTFFPEIESKIINVQLVYPGASPEEIEEGVVNKIEENLTGITGIDRVTSVSRENSATVTIELKLGYKADLVLQDVKNAVDRISSFPVGMEPPVIFKLENLGRAMTFALTGDVDLRTLKNKAREVEDALLNMPQISKVAVAGFPTEEIEIAFREADLRAYGLTFAVAANALRQANIDITGGTIKTQEEELLIRARNKSYYAAGLADVVVKSNPNGSMVYLHQIADIRDRWSDQPDRAFVDGHPAVVFTISHTLAEDMISIVDVLNDYVKKFNDQNTSVRAMVLTDESNFLRQRIDLLSENGIFGIILVVLSLTLFLNWRLAFWVAFAIPFSFAGLFIIARFFGITINVISLFGMIVVIGILVDDGIVVAESIWQERERGKPYMQAAYDGTMKVLPSIVAAVLTTMVAFSAFFFLEGRPGEIFSEMSRVVIITLGWSMLEAMFTLPVHVAHSLDREVKPGPVTTFFDKVMRGMSEGLYAPALRFVMNNKWLTLSGFIALMFISIGAVRGGIVKTTFFPVVDRDDMVVTLKLPAGTREDATMAAMNRIEKATIEAGKELESKYFNSEKKLIVFVRKTLGPNAWEGNVNISLLGGEERDPVSIREITNLIREKTGPIHEAEQLLFTSATPFGRPVSIALNGYDRDALSKATVAVKKELQTLADLSDVSDNNLSGRREILMELTDKGRFLGLQIGDIAAQVRQGFFGGEVQRLQRGKDEVRVWVRYAEADRADVVQLSNMRIRLANGNDYRLGELVNLEITRGVIAINHLNGKREIRVEADVSSDKVSVTDITANLKEEIVPKVLAGFPSVKADFEGQNRTQEQTANSAKLVLPIIIAIMFFMIAITFGSVSQALILLGCVPFGLIGVIWGHAIFGAPISMLSFLGIIALIGIMVNDGLVMVATYNQEMETGEKTQFEALYVAGVSRFRAIFLTSATTILGLGPLVLEKSLQAQFLIPMAISISFGLFGSTLIILLLLPALLMVGNRIKTYALYLWDGEKPPFEMVEPAYPGRRNLFLLYFVAGFLALGIFIAVVMLMNRIGGMIIS